VKKEVVILGAGPAGLWTALHILQKHSDVRATVLEKEALPGGIASSFKREGLTWDLGSHRFHPSAPPEVFSSVQNLLGGNLQRRPRNGRIRLLGRFLKYPLKPLDMFLHLPVSFTAGVLLDTISTPLRQTAPENATFEETLISGLGRTICRRFYFPYARKLWGLNVDALDGEQARRRVSAGKLSEVLKKVLRFSAQQNNKNVFYYPKEGFGSIFQKAVERIESLGGRVVFNAEAVSVQPPSAGSSGKVGTRVCGTEQSFSAGFIFSTIPVTSLARMLLPAPPVEVMHAAHSLRYRSMVLCFIKFDQPSFTGFDAHYFPGEETMFSRISEEKNYSENGEPRNATGLCIEIPCWNTDPVWSMDDSRLIETVLKELSESGFTVPSFQTGFTERLEFAYPSYPLSWENHYRILDTWLTGVQGLVSLGRQGLFAHDNTHHAMAEGMEAAVCLNSELGWNSVRWAQARQAFKKHVVED
jgi:protoporphyrinogen oxidase